MGCRFWSLFIFLTVNAILGYAQPKAATKPPKDWHLLDPEADLVQGLSTEKTYRTLLKGKPSKPVIVAVVDTGVDIDHEDLKDAIWVNEDEIPNNQIDDDRNGYVDDVNGWNFIGGKNGNVNDDSYEVTREYARLKKKFESVDIKKLSKKDKAEYNQYLDYKKKWEDKTKETTEEYALVSRIYSNAIFSLDTLKKFLKSDEITIEQLESIQTNDPVIIFARSFMRNFLKSLGDVPIQERLEEIKDGYDSYKIGSGLAVDPDFEPRVLVGDNYNDPTEKYYGNNQVKPLPGPTGDHGTHVAGIIAADRNNNLGMKGIASNVKIMAIRAVPNGDERDKDIANAIYYAVDNGAKIINLSCGKTESPQKFVVDKAVQYAEEKGVLIIHASGNESADNDKVAHYPTPIYMNGKTAKNWINVGASSWGSGEDFIGSFSNYGKKTVDVFSPGVSIYSTVPGQSYKNHDGTSMACPAVAGVAAMLMSYFPEFSALEIKNIILESSRKFDGVVVPAPGTQTPIPFDQLSKTGGIVNAHDAVQLALKKRAEKTSKR
jgi:subtilisin family serine protease